MVELNSNWRYRKSPAPPRKMLRDFVNAAAKAAGLPETPGWCCDLIFVGDRTMAQMNMELLGHEGTTDVITFCYFEDDMPWDEGDVMVELILCPDAAKREGSKRPGGYARELALYIVHGLLHSAGEDDLEPVARKRMRRRERECMMILEKSFNFPELFREA